MKSVVFALSLVQLCFADLRFASQPKPGRRRRRDFQDEIRSQYEIRIMSRRRVVPFNTTHALYFEPSDFMYAGLIKQRDGRGYDNFLRSNIDNQQDRRDFKTEDGKDHLPFRTYEGAATDVGQATQKHKIPADIEANLLNENTPGVGGFGGTCTCPDGNVHNAGDFMANCGKDKTDGTEGAIACYGGGVNGTCSDARATRGNARSVTCRPPKDGIIEAIPGESVMVPLRWNNPHSAELEVNIWIVNSKYVVPVMKPTCSGEGYQDNYFSFKVPLDFNDLGSKVPGFAGCTKVGDCVLNLYAHSVESRQYSIGSPLLVKGFEGQAATATTETAIEPAREDKGLDVSALRPLCLPRNDPSANIDASTPRHARLISDQWNHAYQNSDFSPYSGQQPESISQNMQAACVLKMIPGNRGELGKQALRADNRAGFNFQRGLDRKAKKLVRQYEKLANSLINLIGGKMKETEVVAPARNFMGENKEQILETCFRCAIVGSTVFKRHETKTYIPSFQIPGNLLPAVQILVSDEYKGLIDENGKVQIYMTAMTDLEPEFVKAEAFNITYQPAKIKTTLSTMADTTKFKKRDADGAEDNGLYAAREAYKIHAHGCPGCTWNTGAVKSWLPIKLAGTAPVVAANAKLAATLSKDFPPGGSFVLPANAGGVTEINDQFDPGGLYADANCDDTDAENVSEMKCEQPTEKLFADPVDIEAGEDVAGVVDGALQQALPFSVLLVCLLHFA